MTDPTRAALSQPEPAGLSDEELLELMPQQFRDDLATVSRMAAHGAGSDVGPGLFRVSLNTGALEFARAAIAADRAQRQLVPQEEEPYPAGYPAEIRQRERMRLRTLLTADADRAERGETINPSEHQP